MTSRNWKKINVRELNDKSSKLRSLLSEYISSKDIINLDSWAFEWSSQEKEKFKLDPFEFKVLHSIRNYQVLKDSYHSLLEANKRNPDNIGLEISLDYEKISSLVGNKIPQELLK